MRLIKTATLVIGISACSGFFSSAAAQSMDNEAPGWLVGIGYVHAADPYIGDAEDASTPVPLVGYIGEHLTWLGPYLSYEWIQTDQLSLRTSLELGFDGFDSDSDDVLLAGLEKRKSALEAGIEVDYGPLSLGAKTDISNRHGGSSLSASIGNAWQLNKRLSLEASLSAQWLSRDIVDYYYGVSSAEALTSRPVYTPGQALNTGIDIQLSYQLGERSMVFIGADAMRLDKEITNSPIVEDDYESSAFVGFVYQLFE